MIRIIGVPKDLVSDGAGKQTGGPSVRRSRSIKFGIDYRNCTTRGKTGRKAASEFRARSPKRLWEYCGEWVSTVRQLRAHNIPSLGGTRVPSEIVEGSTPDMSAYAQLHWCEYVWFYDPMVQFPADARKLARGIGVAHHVGNPIEKKCMYY
jgi:hypothetical protein